jgi:ABC-type oligopeptide transport system substrate-binding subunit
MDRIVFAAIAMLSLGVSLMSGCSQEVAHSESDKPRLFGGRTHEESTTYKNPNGTYSTEKSKVKTD